jgi:hypothetical protein
MGNGTLAPLQSYAFKEWAAVCGALESGRQTIILRKGGIHEGREGFRVAHHQFWLYPTNFHQGTDGLAAPSEPLLQSAAAQQPPSGLLHFRLFADVMEVMELRDEATAQSLAEFHVWSQATVSQRFHYKQPGLFLLIARIYRRPTALEIAESPHFAGCRSWVDLPQPLSTAGLEPVLSDADFERRVAAIHQVGSFT